MNFKYAIVLLLTGVFLFGPGRAFAHVTVKPDEVGVGQRLNFIVSVPTEEAVPTTQLRLVLPEGLQSVRPNAKSGWNIRLVKEGEGESSKVSEIIWSGGNIPVDLRDEFVFSAQVPAQESSLVWKAYQTYSDGDIAAWDNDPKAVEEYTKTNPPAEGKEDDHNAPKPYSVTKVTNDLKASSVPAQSEAASVSGDNNFNSVLSVAAIVLAVIALGMQFLKKKQ